MAQVNIRHIYLLLLAQMELPIPESVKICHSSTEDFCCQVVRENRRNACCLSRFYRAA